METNLYHNHIPSFGGNLAVAIIFGILVSLQILFGLYFKQKKLLWLLAAGTTMETIGYAGRVWASKAADNTQPYIMQSVCISIGPGFLLSALYYLVGQLVILFGQSLFGLELELYEVGLNAVGLIFSALMAAGIGVAASASTEAAVQRGVNCLIAGFSIQLVAIVFSQGLWYLFLYRIWKSILSSASSDFTETHEHVRKGKYFKLYCLSISLCFIFITVRTCYRIAEYAEGWINSHLYYEETYFMILEALMILLTSILLTCFHPGLVFGKDSLHKIDKSMEFFRNNAETKHKNNPFSDDNEAYNLENAEDVPNKKSEEANSHKGDFNIPLPIIGTIINIARYCIRRFRK